MAQMVVVDWCLAIMCVALNARDFTNTKNANKNLRGAKCFKNKRIYL